MQKSTQVAGGSRQNSDRRARTDGIASLAEQIFGESKKANLWLNSPDERLAGHAPLEVLDTESGFKSVEALLWQIDEGIFG